MYFLNNMRILNIREFVVERMKIKPVTNAELNDVKKRMYFNRPLSHLGSSPDEPGVYEKAKEKYNIPVGGAKELMNALKEARKIMDHWKHVDKLSVPELVKRHQLHANAITKPEALIATMAYVFYMYKSHPSYGMQIIDIYVDRLCEEFNLTLDDIVNIFFKK